MTSSIQTKIQERNLSQWHLFVASLLGSLASQKGMFNQAFLNRLLRRSMREYVIPYMAELPEFAEAKERIAVATSDEEKMKAVVVLLDKVFPLAGSLSVAAREDDTPGAVVEIVSNTCRFCPIGVGDASLPPGKTFCPFPIMMEEVGLFLLGESSIKTHMTREGTSTQILQKRDGSCYITFDMKS